MASEALGHAQAAAPSVTFPAEFLAEMHSQKTPRRTNSKSGLFQQLQAEEFGYRQDVPPTNVGLNYFITTLVVPAATTHPADDPESAGGRSFHPAGSTPMSGSAVPETAGGPLDTTGGIHAFFLDSDEDEQIGLSRVAAEPDSDDEVLAEILLPRIPYCFLFFSESPTSPPRSGSKHRRVRLYTSLWDRPVDDFLSSESESDDDIEEYIPPIPYGAFKDWEIVRCPLRDTYYHVYHQENRRHRNFFYLKELLPHVYREDLLLLRRRMNRYFRLNPDVDIGLDLWRDVNLLCQSLHSDDVEDFWRTQDEWVVSGWRLYPKSSVHVLDLTNGKTVYMFVDKFYPIRAPLLERMLRHRLTVPPSYCRDVVVAGSVIQTIQDGLRESYECLASAPIVDMVINPPWNLPFLGCPKIGPRSLSRRATVWKLLLRDVAVSFDSAVHRDHADSLDAVVPSLVSAACCTAAGYFAYCCCFVPAVFQSSCFEKIYLETWF
ncbi:hypothetical protein Tco_0123266 [Tanacetum coccineum]